MFKTTAFIGLGLCILVLSGCTPKIDGSSAKSYESSLVKVASGLDRDKKAVFNQALDIVASHTPPTKELSAEANKRVSLADKTAEQIIEEATKIAVEELDKLKLEEKDNTKISGKDVLANTSIKVLSIQGEDYGYEGTKYDAVIQITNKNNFDIDGIIAEVRGIDNSGNSQGWYGVIGFGRKKLQGVVSSGATRKAHVYILDNEQLDNYTFWTNDSSFDMHSRWNSVRANRPTMNNLSIKVTPNTVYAGDRSYSGNSYDDMKKQLPADLDQFLTLIKYKR